MSNNTSNHPDFSYGNPISPTTDPYAYYRPVPEPPKKTKPIKLPKILTPFILAALVMFFIFVWMPPDSAIAFYLWQYGIPYYAFLCGVGLVTIMAFSAWLKHKLVEASPKDLKMVGANLNEFPGVDFYEFERNTADLQQLGFVFQTDYRTQTSKVDHPTGIARVMLHPERRCFVEINQINIKGKVFKVHCGIMSYALRQQNGRSDILWMLSTTNRELLSTSYALRHSWSYGASIPGAGPLQLFESHLIRRGELINEAGIDVSDDISCETYFALIRQRLDSHRKLVRRKNILLLLLRTDLFEIRPKTEWSGKQVKV